MKTRSLMLVLLSTWLCHSSEVMFLNPARIGRSVLSVEPLLVSPTTDAVAPDKITLEVTGTRVSGAVLEYPKVITKEMLR